MKIKKVIIGVTIGITAAILWSVVFINSLNSMAGIGIGICLGEPVNKSGHEKYYFLNLIFKSRH